MLLSMTGFGNAEIKQNGISVSVEIKSLNSRFLEMNFKLPKILQSKEFEIREIIRRKVSRGKISVAIDIEFDRSLLPFDIDFELASYLVKLLREVKKRTKLRGEVNLEHLLKFRDMFWASFADSISNEHWEIVKKAIDRALDELLLSKRKEGVEILNDVENRINLISDAVEKILSFSEQNLRIKQSALRQRIDEIFRDIEFDKNRLESEIVWLANKLDITEECVRLKSHVKFFLETLRSNDDTVGRKLTFLLQEMLREVTTIGAKSEDTQITYLVVSIKEEIEKIREQLQNVE